MHLMQFAGGRHNQNALPYYLLQFNAPLLLLKLHLPPSKLTFLSSYRVETYFV